MYNFYFLIEISSHSNFQKRWFAQPGVTHTRKRTVKDIYAYCGHSSVGDVFLT